MTTQVLVKPLRFLILPHLSACERGGASPDVIVIRTALAWVQLQDYLSPALSAIVPVVDVSGHYPGADVRMCSMSALTLAQAFRQVEPVLAQMERLPAVVFDSSDPLRWLLARLAVRNRLLEPAHPQQRPHYAESCFMPDIAVAAEHLADMGLVKRHIRYRMKMCPACASCRLSIHTQCIRSANEPCNCGAQHSTSGDRFMCEDCGSRGAYDQLAQNPALAYELTDSGRAAAFSDMALQSWVPGARERQAFIDQMRCRTLHDEPRSGLLRVQFQTRKTDQLRPAELGLLLQRICDVLRPLASPYIFSGCVIGHFSDYAADLPDSLPHLKDILGAVDADLQLDLIYPQDVVMMAQFERSCSQSASPMPQLPDYM